MNRQVDVLCIGHIDKGIIVVEGNRTDATGGAIHYGGMVLRKLGLKIAVLTRVAKQDYPVITEETTAVENVIPDRNSDQRTCYLLGFAGMFRVEDIPAVDARVYYVGTIVPRWQWRPRVSCAKM